MSLPTLSDYLPGKAEVLFKLAEEAVAPPVKKEEPIERPLLHAAKTVGGGLLALSAGTAMGFGAAELGNRAYKGITGNGLPMEYAIPLLSSLGAGAGLAYQNYKARELKELQRAYQSYRDQRKGRPTGQ